MLFLAFISNSLVFPRQVTGCKYTRKFCLELLSFMNIFCKTLTFNKKE